ncbi:MAG: cobyrinate a,c-diamide synthase [Lachnospiraceae bacterium]|nr:cobyrinate a,c-diamide synthase [Lachnospiraceae bacterium]
MQLRRVMIAAPKSGSGKTMITCALLKALKNRREKVLSYKCGPDYIDPMFHEKALGVPAGNLDTFFTGEEETRKILAGSAKEENFVVMEGVMGLFDGLGGSWEEGSSYHLAKVTKTPIVLVADVKGMGVRSMIPMLAGFLLYDKERLIKGVLLNRISEEYYKTVKPLIEEELQIPVLGFIPEAKDLCIESRHLGLVMPQELNGIKEKLQKMAERLENTVSVSTIMEIAESAEELDVDKEHTEDLYLPEEMALPKDKPVIAVAKDEAFCFYYRENLLLLEKSGAEIKYFSPIWDQELPPGCHGILLGGGYPELYAEKLSLNHNMHKAIRQAVESGMPIVAECGGFMYLHSFLTDKNGISYTMAGVIPGKCFYTNRLVRFGYIEIQEEESFFLPKGRRIKGHEFHYFDSTDNGNGAVAVKPVTGRSYSCIMAGENHWMGFPHLYYPSNPEFARSFVEKASQYKRTAENCTLPK